MKVTLFILTKIFLITPPNMSSRKNQPSDSKFEFAGGVANWCRVGYELSVVNMLFEFLVTD